MIPRPEIAHWLTGSVCLLLGLILLSEAIVGAGETWITEMSTAELRDLFALRQDASGNLEAVAAG